MQNSPCDAVPLPIRGKILAEASAATLGDRNKTYGEPYPDMALSAEFMRIFMEHADGKYCEAHNEAIRRVFIKLARLACGAAQHRDSYVDLAAYAAIAYECEELHRVEESNKRAAQSNFNLQGIDRTPHPHWKDAMAVIRDESDNEHMARTGHWPKDDTMQQTTGPLPQFYDGPIAAGLRFKIEGCDDVFEIRGPIMPTLDKFNAVNTESGAEQMMHRRAIKLVFKPGSNMRCIHCPDKTALPGKDICGDCFAPVAPAKSCK